MNVSGQIVAAIQSREILEVFYKGEWRTLEPYLLGYNQKNNLCLSAFQTSGGSGSDWRAYLLSSIAEVRQTGSYCEGIRDGYNPADSTMHSILAAV